MGYDVASVKTEERHEFKKSIPYDAEDPTYVLIATTTPRVNQAIGAFLAHTTYLYGESGMQSQWEKSFEQLKRVACQATLLETNFKRNKRNLFPHRKDLRQGFKPDEFDEGWYELRPDTITDEWFAFFLMTNPKWYHELKDFWLTNDWIDEWLGGWEVPDPLASK